VKRCMWVEATSVWAVDYVFLVGGTFLLAGLVKGVIGLGLPTVSLAVGTATLGLEAAMSLLLVPSFVTNVWQAVDGKALRIVSRRLAWLLCAVCFGTYAGVHVLTAVDAAVMTAVLGVLLFGYAATSLWRPVFKAPGQRERWLSALVGLSNGVLTGMTGSFVVPGVLYLQLLGLGRDALIQAMGVLFTVSTLALAVSLGAVKGLAMSEMAASSAAVVPALIGMQIGRVLRRRLSEQMFRQVFFGALLMLGAYIAVRSIA